MWSKVFIAVIVILAFPTGLILISQNASPGDNTYPIKRGMEGVLSSIFSLNPVTRAYFRTDLSSRRFKESVVLLKRNNVDKTMTNTSLVEMLSTTAVASADIKKVSDPALKKRLADDLTAKIATYRQSLLQLAKEKKQTQTATVILTPTLIPGQPTPTPTRVTPTPTLVPGQPTPTQSIPTPTPTLVVKVCTDNIRNYSQCGGTTGYTNYPNTHLLMISEHKNSCTGAINNVVTDDWDLGTIVCDPAIIGQCSADNLEACSEALAKLAAAAQVDSSSSSGSGSGGGGIKGGAQSFSAGEPTPTPTPTPRRSVFQILQASQSATPSATPTTTEEIIISTDSGLVKGISTRVKENLILTNVVNSFRQLISIFR